MKLRDLLRRKSWDAFTKARHGGRRDLHFFSYLGRAYACASLYVSQNFVNGFHSVVLAAVDKVDNMHLHTRLTGEAEGSKKPIDKVNMLATIKIIAAR